MTITDVKKITEDEALKRLNDLIDLDYYLDECKTCKLPSLLNKGSTCTRGNRVELQEECEIWQEYRKMIKPIIVWMKRRENEKTQWTKGLEH